eukprot:7326442-Prymnesium_polylepis.1
MKQLGGRAFLDAKLQPGCVAAIVWCLSTPDHGSAVRKPHRRATLRPTGTAVATFTCCHRCRESTHEPQHVLARPCDHDAIPQHKPEEVGDCSGPSHTVLSRPPGRGRRRPTVSDLRWSVKIRSGSSKMVYNAQMNNSEPPHAPHCDEAAAPRAAAV